MRSRLLLPAVLAAVGLTALVGQESVASPADVSLHVAGPRTGTVGTLGHSSHLRGGDHHGAMPDGAAIDRMDVIAHITTMCGGSKGY